MLFSVAVEAVTIANYQSFRFRVDALCRIDTGGGGSLTPMGHTKNLSGDGKQPCHYVMDYLKCCCLPLTKRDEKVLFGKKYATLNINVSLA